MDTKKKPQINKLQKLPSETFLKRNSSPKKKPKKFLCKKKRPLLHKKPTLKIDPKSRRLASRSQPEMIITDSRAIRTYEMLKRTSCMPKLVHLDLNDLRLTRTVNPSPHQLKLDRSNFTTPKVQTPVSFPSISCMTDRSPEQHFIYLPEDITKRNQLILHLKSQSQGNLTPDPGFLNLPFEQRSKIWQKNKKEKLLSLVNEKKLQKDTNCTFQPLTNSRSKQTSPKSSTSQSVFGYSHRRTASQITSRSGKTSVLSNFSQNEDTALIYRQFSTNGTSPLSLNNMCPVQMDIRYHPGFSYELRSRSKPVIRYQDL